MANVVFSDIQKIYDNNVQAVFDFNLNVSDKEFIVLVGPSGCGKSTTLRMLAGLEEISFGTISIDGKIINNVHPKDRDIAMVFQNYALYPHMTVFDNMAFALKLKRIPIPTLDENGNEIYVIDKKKIKSIKGDIKKRKKELSPEKISELENKIKELETTPSLLKCKYRKYSKAEIKEKIENAAKILDLTPYLKRKPAALSGGQRQRVALGRAIVRTPKVFLMDEPLSNLDAKLRVQTRSEIIRIHKQVGATTIYVTHDQIEAMTMADRIVIMKDGYIQQIGTPKDVYNSPSNIFVGGFIGTPPMNFFNGTFTKNSFVFDGQDPISIKLPKEISDQLKTYEDKEIVLGIRPEDVFTDNEDKRKKPSDPIEIVSDLSELLGNERIIYAKINDSQLIAKTDCYTDIEKDNKFLVFFDLNKIHFFDKETTLRIF